MSRTCHQMLPEVIERSANTSNDRTTRLRSAADVGGWGRPDATLGGLDEGCASIRTILGALLVLLAMGCAACGSSAPATASTSVTSSSAPAPSVSVALTASLLDPKMAELTKNLRACAGTHPLLLDCMALKDFEESNDDYFHTVAADQALLDMLTGTDERLAVIATKRDGHDPRRAHRQGARHAAL